MCFDSTTTSRWRVLLFCRSRLWIDYLFRHLRKTVISWGTVRGSPPPCEQGCGKRGQGKTRLSLEHSKQPRSGPLDFDRSVISYLTPTSAGFWVRVFDHCTTVRPPLRFISFPAFFVPEGTPLKVTLCFLARCTISIAVG